MNERMTSLLFLGAVVLVFVLLGAAYWTVRVPDASSRGGALVPDPELRDELARDVTALASFSQRNALDLAALRTSAEIIRQSFAASGYRVETQKFAVEKVEYENVIAELRGTELPGEVVVIGAHYDTVFDSPGADDNASGVAGLLAVARRLASEPQRRTIRFVAFCNEEPPFFRSPQMGSHHYAKLLRDRHEKVVAMISVESIGFFSSDPGTQRYPKPLDSFYPSTADFIGVVGNTRSRALVVRTARAFAAASPLPVEAAALPGIVGEAAWSDHWSFWQFGVPALMITDTALFRNPQYHTPEDLPGTLDYERMTAVVRGMLGVARDLGSR